MTDPSIVARGYDAVYGAMPLADRPVRAAPPSSASGSRRLAVASSSSPAKTTPTASTTSASLPVASYLHISYVIPTRGIIGIQENHMPVVRITRNYQVSIPKSVRDALGLEEGDLIEVEERSGEIVMVPKKLIDAAQAWFWSPEWQRGEREVDEDIRAGRVIGPFKNIEELKKHFGDA